MLRFKLVSLACTTLFLASGCSRAATDNTSPPQDTGELKNPVRTQIEDGAALFGQHCASCHGAAGEGLSAPMLVGAGALPKSPPQGRVHRTGEFATVLDVFEFTRVTMPPSDPTALSDADVWAILAFDLSANGIELTLPLDATAAGALPLE